MVKLPDYEEIKTKKQFLTISFGCFQKSLQFSSEHVLAPIASKHKDEKV